MLRVVSFLSFGVWLFFGSRVQAAETDVEELLRLLRSGVGEMVAREWLTVAEFSTAPTANQLLDLKAAGASDELLVDLVRRSGEAKKRYALKRVHRVDTATGRSVMELTNKAVDGSFPPPPAGSAPAARAVEPDPPMSEPAWMPSIYEPPEPVFIEVERPAPAPVYSPPVSTSRLRIIPARGPRAYYESANPPGHHDRYFGADGEHFPHYRQDTYPYPPPFFFWFDVRAPFFQGNGPVRPVTPPAAYQPHPSLYQSRPVGFEHR